MYEQYFGLNRSPFSLSPDPKFLLLTPKHREALGGLLFAVTVRKGFMVLTGQAGTGKTTLVRKLLSSIPAKCARFSVIVNPKLNASELLESVLMDYGVSSLPSSKAMRLALLRRLLLQADKEGKTSVLVVDEAHLLTSEALEEIRLLSNFETSEHKLLQIILAGQSELNDVLDQQSMRHVKQRIAARVDLAPLAEKDIAEYVAKRWACAGGSGPIPFSEPSLSLLARGSSGIPRVINALCDAALTNAYGKGIRNVDAKDMLEVLSDMHLAPLAAGADADVTLTHQNEAAPVDASAPFVFRSLQRYTPKPSRARSTLRWAHWFGLSSESRS
jgi:general secretion pathway protein A